MPATTRLPSASFSLYGRDKAWLALRAGPGALIVLVHLVLLGILLRYAGMPSFRETLPPANYISLKLLPATSRPQAVEAPASTPPPVLRPRKARVEAAVPVHVAPLAVPTVQEAPEAQAEPAAPQEKRLDMGALRADARRIAREHVPEPFEQVRDAEHRLEADKKDLGRAIREAKRPPCTKKYSGGTSVNVFALIPLAIDTITDTGCKW